MRFNLYTVLNIPPYTNDQHLIKAAYRKQLKYYHPDSRNVEPDRAQKVTWILNETYRIFSDPARKADYDLYLSRTENDPM